MSCFRFIAAERANHAGAVLRRVLRVSRSGYYAWSGRPASPRAVADGALTATIRQIHAQSRGTYGASRVHAELALEHRVSCGRKRGARLMRTIGLVGFHRRQAMRTTRRDETVPRAPDLVGRRFTADRPDSLWVADITYLPT